MSTEARQRFLIRQAVEALLGQVVGQVETLMEALIAGVKELEEESGKKDSRLEKKQLDNFLGVARETDSVAVVQNWVRYQIGRQEKTWGKRTGFGEKLLADLNAWRNRAKTIAVQVYGVETPNDTQVDAVHIQIIRQYAGQLNRYFVYASVREGWRER